MKKDDARNWIRAFGDLPDELRETCRHGHGHCSNTRGGACFDDAIQAAVINVDGDTTCQTFPT